MVGAIQCSDKVHTKCVMSGHLKVTFCLPCCYIRLIGMGSLLIEDELNIEPSHNALLVVPFRIANIYTKVSNDCEYPIISSLLDF